ncbi:VWA domain-containing protein [Serpentinicella sp. ANB-PHB4]|uniref:vWA domain-containing protein n=1 Tax=Serpentinicella sp. ANB-PHB4 TaxID=3074076 RepID=UPI00285901B5|nr:VWA domain-containing protein [Serpentinicella sp. ANB-PHB4]MDR5659122.1 VWA domain-containing protein [Serpentinicella sp. ANB-PHB4]
MEKDVLMRQIILVTDGQSNVGGDPVVSASKAFKKNIVVNTIGIVDKQDVNDQACDEINNIAKAGGGQYEHTFIDHLSYTMQSMTMKTVNQTIQEAVNSQLKELIGQELENMAPPTRSKLLDYVERFSEEVQIDCCILMDCSGSMAKKIDEARYSILDLMKSFKARKGKVNLAVVAFPGSGASNCEVIHHFTDNIAELENRIYRINAKGGTPTASAIDQAIDLIEAFNGGINKSGEILEMEECTG